MAFFSSFFSFFSFFSVLFSSLILVAERALKDFSSQIDGIHKKFGFLRRELDRFCSTKIRIWINNNKMRSAKSPHHLHSLTSSQLQQSADMDDAEMSGDTEPVMLDAKREEVRQEDSNGRDSGSDSKRQKVDGESLHPSFRLENFLPQAKSSLAQSVDLPDGH